MDNRRKNYFIKKEFQRDFILKFCGLVILGAVLSGAIVYSMSASTLTTTFENSRLRIKSTAEFILPAVLLSSVVVIVFIGLATVGVTLFASHKIAGPLYRMEMDVREVASGNLNVRFRLRHTDEIRALADSLDAMVVILRSSVGELRSIIDNLDSKTPPGEMKQKISQAKAVLSRFNA
jgi:methyl-accepting chemotaxis protein